MPVTHEDLQHIAELARLALDPARAPRLVEELNGILAHMDVLARTDTRTVCGTAGVGDAGMPLREDSGPPLPLTRGREEFAPLVRDGFLLVPRLATHEVSSESGE